MYKFRNVNNTKSHVCVLWGYSNIWMDLTIGIQNFIFFQTKKNEILMAGHLSHYDLTIPPITPTRQKENVSDPVPEFHQTAWKPHENYQPKRYQ